LAYIKINPYEMSLKLSLRIVFLIVLFFPCYSVRGQRVQKPLSLNKLISQYKAVTSFYESKLKDNPKDIQLRLQLANFYYSFRQYQRAIDLLKNTKTFQAQVLLAKSYARLKDYDYAIEIFERVNNLSQKNNVEIDDNEYFYLYASVLEHKNMFTKAIKEYQKAKDNFYDKAKARIRNIQSSFLKEVPFYVKSLSRDSKSFLKKVPEEAVFIYLVDENIEVTHDNTEISTVHVVEKVLKERGKNIAEVEIGYDSTYERVELVFARTITKDGRVVSVGRENIRDVSKYLNFPLYSNARAFIISMPSVEVGSIIDYKVKVYSSKLVDKDNFNFIYRLREKYPIFKAQFNLIVPKTKRPHFKYFHRRRAGSHSLRPKVADKEDSIIYSWKFKDIKPIIPEYNMPPASEINPAILISSFSSWGEIYNWWEKLFSDKIKLNDGAKKLVDTLIKDADTRLDKAKKIYEFCAKQIRYVAVEYGESGYEPHSANEVLLNRYGDCKDQAILLTAMLRYAGFKAYPVLVPTRSVYPIDKDFPSINFNHAICALKHNGRLIFMDPTAETTSFKDLPLGDQNREVMVFGKKAIIARTPTKKDNAAIYTTKIILDKNEKAVIKRLVTTKGFFSSSQRWYLKHTHPDKIKEDIQNKMVEISSFAKLLSYRIENKDDFDKAPVLTYRFRSPQFLNPARNLRIVSIPDDMHISYDLIAKEKRLFPIDFGGILTKRSQVVISLPQNLKVKYLPQDTKHTTKYFDFMATYKNQNHTITINREFHIKQRFVNEAEYKLFKKKLEEVFFLLREEVILEKI